MIIDKLAYNSKLRNIAPIAKLLFSMSVLVICIWANSFLVSVFTALTMLFLIIFIGKTSYKNVFHLMTVPIVFIIMGAAAIAISIGQNSGDMLFSLHFGNTYFGVSHTSLLSAVRVMIKCFGAVSCMYFLSLTTPMVDLFTLLRKSIIPNFIIEIAELIYRYIFVLFDVSHRIHTAQDARLGYSNLRVSYHSTAQLASNLFIRSFNQAEKTYTAMESRGYDGEINVIMPKINHSVKFNVFAVIYVVITTAIAIFSYKYDESHFALSDLSIGFEKGKITTILGANGAGKSTLFLNMNGILKPHSGTVKFMGKPIGYSKKEIRELRKSVGIVFQDPDDQLFSASVFQDVSFGAMNLKLPQDEVVHLTENALKRTGIFDLKDKPTHALSFGQKKRAAIAGILVMSPEVIILDEPTAGLDPMGVSELMHLLRDICENEGTTIIMSTHDIDVVPIYSDYVYVINHGKLLTDGTPEEVFSNPTLLREHNLRLPRIAHLLEILNKCDKLNVDFSKATIGKAREEILNLIRGK